MNKRMDRCRSWIEDGLCAVLPVYGENGGNETRMLFLDKQPCREPRKVQTLIQCLAEFYQRDVSLIRKQAQEVLGQRTMNPLWISDCITLVPFKVRKPVARDDGAVGYVWENAIQDVEDGDGAAFIILKDNQRIKVLDRGSTARKHIREAQQLHRFQTQLVQGSMKKEMVWKEMQESYNQPATRGDIAMLSRNILSLMERLKLY